MAPLQCAELIRSLCATIHLPDAQRVIDSRQLVIDGFDVHFDEFEEDPGSLYLYFQFGTTTAGRTLTVFRLMLEANVLIYAQEHAQLGVDPEHGGMVLLVRLPLSSDLTGALLADTLCYYVEHGKYWRDNIQNSSDEMFEGIASGQFTWVRA